MAPTAYNLVGDQDIAFFPQNGTGIGGDIACDGLWLFVIGPNLTSPGGNVQCFAFQNDGTGNFVQKQAITAPGDASSLVFVAYSDSSGNLILSDNSNIYLYTLVAGVWTNQNTFAGGNIGGHVYLLSPLSIDGNNAVCLGKDTNTGHYKLLYFTIAANTLTLAQNLESGLVNPNVRNPVLHGTHLIVQDRTHSNALLYELSGGLFSLIQTIGTSNAVGLSPLGYAFVCLTGAGNQTCQVYQFALGSWTLVQTIVPPAGASNTQLFYAFAFHSPASNADIVVLSGFYSAASGTTWFQALFFDGANWTQFQFAPNVGGAFQVKGVG